LKKWSTLAQDFGAVASSILVVAALTDNLRDWPSGRLNWSVSSLFTLIAVVYLVKLIAAIFVTEPRKTYSFRRPKEHRILDDVWAVGCLVKALKLDAAAAKRRMDLKIRKWMLRELNNSSTATIFTRDLSWAEPTDEPLVRLARGGSLRIVSCAVSHSPSAQAELSKFELIGATVDHWKIDAPARFSVFEKDGRQKVAVALPDKRRHLIAVSDDKEDGLFRLAMGVVSAIDGPKVRGI